MATVLVPEISLILRASRRAWTKTKPFHSSLNPIRSCRGVATHTHSFHAEQVSIIRSNVDTSNPDFKENARAMNEAIERINALHGKLSLGGPEKARQRHVARGKMLPREYGSQRSALLKLC